MDIDGCSRVFSRFGFNFLALTWTSSKSRYGLDKKQEKDVLYLYLCPSFHTFATPSIIHDEIL
jgi:hypothetical protein